MGKLVNSLLILLLLIFVDFSKASTLFNVRKLSEKSTNGVTNNTTVSPTSNPVSGDKQASPVATKHETEEKQDMKPTPPSTSGEDKSKDKKVENNKGSTPSTNTKEDKTPKEQVKEKSQSKSDSPPIGSESCDGVEKSCRDSKSMIACIKSPDNALSKALVLIQNGGDSSLKVDVKTSLGNEKTVVDLSKHQNKKVDISVGNGGSNIITLNAGHGDCVLQIGVVASQGYYYPEWLPSYSKFMTPMYGAYFLLVMTIVAGTICTCCWFGKKRKGSDIPYQELEMSMPETAETAQGWDQVWDDDWDEEKAVKSPGGRNISGNGLTSRSSKRDGWEDWDD